jgi:uncharacterized protein DUF6364/PIN domain-containing protein
MTTKLTLTLDDKVIEGAKRYARAKGRSVSELVESYFKSLTELSRIIEIIGLSKDAVMQALVSDFSDFENALQHYAALAGDVKVIITRNTKDYKNSQLAVLTPDQYLKSRA